jgi:hypothetical protein
MAANRSIILFVLFCLGLAGCGSGAPPRPVARDSTPSPAPTVPPAVSEVESAGGRVAAAESPVPRAGDTVPATVAKTFPAAASIERSARPFPHRVIRDRDDVILGYEAFTDSAGTTARGYAGMVPLQVYFNARGRPVRIYVLDNCETPAYLDLVYRAGLLDTLLAYDPANPDSVDAVTLATSSSHALIGSLTGLAARVAAEIVPKAGGGAR